MARPELESALSSLDTWIVISGILVAIGILGEVGFGLRHWSTNRRLRALQQAEEQAHEIETGRLAAESAKAAKDAEEARKDTAAWSARIADAEARVAEARKDAELATATAKQFESRIAEANARAAEAAEKAEAERLARVKIEQAMTHRRLLPQGQAAVALKLRAFAGQKISVSPLSQDLEVQRITDEIVTALAGPNGAGWVVAFRAGLSVGGPAVIGIGIGVKRDAEPRTRAAAVALMRALGDEGLGVVGSDDPAAGLAPQDATMIAIAVGTRPGM